MVDDYQFENKLKSYISEKKTCTGLSTLDEISEGLVGGDITKNKNVKRKFFFFSLQVV